MDAGSGTVEVLPAQRCELWPAPDGSAALTRIGGRLELFADRADRDPLVVSHGHGYIVGSPAWRPDGAGFAYCLRTGEGPLVQVVSRDGLRGETIPGACRPAWLSDGRLAVARGDPPASITAGNETLLGRNAIGRLLPKVPAGAERSVSSLSADGGRLFVGLLAEKGGSPLAAALAVVEESGRVETSARLASGVAPAAFGLSPDGQALWYVDGETRNCSRRPALRGAAASGRRSPGRVVAQRALPRRCERPGDRHHDLAGGREVAVVPVIARDVAWTAG